jgi:hypothetical protein
MAREAGALTKAIDAILDDAAAKGENPTPKAHLAELKKVAKGKSEKQIAGAFNNRKMTRKVRVRKKGRKAGRPMAVARRGKAGVGGSASVTEALRSASEFVAKAGGIDAAQSILDAMKKLLA